jgi:hypothetical protein
LQINGLPPRESTSNRVDIKIHRSVSYDNLLCADTGGTTDFGDGNVSLGVDQGFPTDYDIRDCLRIRWWQSGFTGTFKAGTVSGLESRMREEDSPLNRLGGETTTEQLRFN